MTYSVKEIFYTLQGEGSNAGRPAVFCRFAGCNLWNGRERDRAAAVCRFCDTDFVGTDGTFGGRYRSASDLAARIAAQWPGTGRAEDAGARLAVLTGGEPLLQVDGPLVDALHAEGFEIAVETNGTVAPPPGLDWICVSPKGHAPLVVRAGHELKVVVPQPEFGEADMAAFRAMDFEHFLVQPMDGPEALDNTRWAVQWCLEHPGWRLSVQSHKTLGIR